MMDWAVDMTDLWSQVCSFVWKSVQSWSHKSVPPTAHWTVEVDVLAWPVFSCSLECCTITITTITITFVTSSVSFCLTRLIFHRIIQMKQGLSNENCWEGRCKICYRLECLLVIQPTVSKHRRLYWEVFFKILQDCMVLLWQTSSIHISLFPGPAVLLVYLLVMQHLPRPCWFIQVRCPYTKFKWAIMFAIAASQIIIWYWPISHTKEFDFCRRLRLSTRVKPFG